jgi:hypothetical protein
MAKSTTPKAAKAASVTLKNPSTGTASKSAAGSALSQKGNQKTTSSNTAKDASKVLRDGRTSTTSKSAAGSALSQTVKKLETSSSSTSGTSSGGPRTKSKK